MIGALSAIPTPFHRLSAGRKLAALCLFCTAVGMAPWVLAGWVAFGFVLALSLVPGGWFLRLILSDLKGIAFIAALIGGFQWLTGNPFLGLRIAGTLLACVSAAMVFSRTTSPAETLDVIDRLLAACRVGPVLRRRLSLAVAMTFRFIPALSERAGRLTDAHRARAPRRVSWRIVAPLALGALDEADHAAEALRARVQID